MKKEQLQGLEQWDKVYEKIVLNSPNGILIINDDFQIVQLNETAASITGLPRESVLGEMIFDLFPKIRKPLEQDDDFIYCFGEKNLHIKKLSITKDADSRSRTTLFIQEDQDELADLEDIQEKDFMAEHFNLIFEGSFDGMLVTDGKGNVLFVNQAYERITGIKREEMAGKNMVELLNSEWMRESVVFPVIEKKSPVSMNHTTRIGKNIIVTGKPVCDRKGDVTLVVVNARDVSEIYELKEELMKSREMEKLYFSQLKNEESAGGDEENNVVIVNDKMKQIYSLAKKISVYNTNVLILGESGVGKEELAKYIHQRSQRCGKPFVVVNCAAIPENLLETEFFGYEKGAFTGAAKEKEGLFETADKGTLFLDEIGEIMPNLQVKLLRFLETREITRVGGTKPIVVDVRILTATNKNLRKMVQEGTFREDLYYRLNVVEIDIPPLRERVEDIGPLSLNFINRFNKKYGQNKKLTYDAIGELEKQEWRGNVRELKNVIERMIVVSNNEFLQIDDVYWANGKSRRTPEVNNIKVRDIMPLNDAVEEVEQQLLQQAMRRMSSTRKIAEILKVDQSTIVRKMKKYGLKKE